MRISATRANGREQLDLVDGGLYVASPRANGLSVLPSVRPLACLFTAMLHKRIHLITIVSRKGVAPVVPLITVIRCPTRHTQCAIRRFTFDAREDSHKHTQLCFAYSEGDSIARVTPITTATLMQNDSYDFLKVSARKADPRETLFARKRSEGFRCLARET